MIGRLNPWLIVSSSSSTSPAMWHLAGLECRGRSRGEAATVASARYLFVSEILSRRRSRKCAFFEFLPMTSCAVEAFGSILFLFFLSNPPPTSPQPAGLASSVGHFTPPPLHAHTLFYDGLSALISSSDRTLMPCHSSTDLDIIFLFSARQ